MDKTKQVLLGLLGIIVLSVGSSYAQPRIPKEDIPTNIAFDVKQAIDMLYSPDGEKRADGVEQLRRVGEDQAIPAIPYLLGMLDDNTTLNVVSKIQVDHSTKKVTLLRYFIRRSSGIEERLTNILGELTLKSLSRMEKEAFTEFLEDNPRIRSSTLRFTDSSGKEVVLVKEISNLRSVVGLTLKKITGKDFEDDQTRWVEWWENNKGSFLKGR